MSTKAQHAEAYQPVPGLLRALREEATLSQRELGRRLGKPQSWVHNCEVGNRRVDVSEFADWAAACDADPGEAFGRFLGERARHVTSTSERTGQSNPIEPG